jgi:spectinomycin phosphotransferase
LREGLKTLETITQRDRPGQQQLKALLLPHNEEILDYLNRLYELRSLARAMPRPRALCHTDLASANLLLDEHGELYILHWEGAMLPPPEHDLFLFTGEHFPISLKHYEQECGPVPLDGEVFGCHFYRRNLERLTDWLVRILYENAHDEQDQSDLEGIRKDCMGWWPALEADIGLVKWHFDSGGAPPNMYCSRRRPPHGWSGA